MAGGLKIGIAGMCNCRGAGGRPASDALRFMGGFLCSRRGCRLFVFGKMSIFNAIVGVDCFAPVPSHRPNLVASEQGAMLA